MSQSSTNGAGHNATFNISNSLGHYQINNATGGAGYAIGDTITISGSL